MEDGSQRAGGDVATAEDLTHRLAELRSRMATLEESITGRPARLLPAPVEISTQPPVALAPPAARTSEAPARPAPHPASPPPDRLARDVPGPGPMEEQTPPQVAAQRVQPAPGVDPNDPVLALGVADPDALDAWLTDEIAVIDPHATGEQDTITTEIDAITKPKVYDTLAPEDGDGGWQPPVRREPVTVEPVSHAPALDAAEARRWIALLVVAAILVGMIIAVAWWLSSQPDGAAALPYPFSSF